MIRLNFGRVDANGQRRDNGKRIFQKNFGIHFTCRCFQCCLNSQLRTQFSTSGKGENIIASVNYDYLSNAFLSKSLQTNLYYSQAFRASHIQAELIVNISIEQWQC